MVDYDIGDSVAGEWLFNRSLFKNDSQFKRIWKNGDRKI